MARFRRVLLLVHPYFRPDRKKARSQTEKDVWLSLRRMGVQCQICAVQQDLVQLEKDLAEFRPHVALNLLEEFRNEGVFDFHVVSYLEAKGVPVTGCNPRGMIVSRNKLWCAQLAAAAGVQAPLSCPANEVRSRPWQGPWILKYNLEHASLGLSQANVVHSFKEYQKRMRALRRRVGAEILAQQFIAGREASVSVLGSKKLWVFEPRELKLPKAESVATEKIKFSASFRRVQKIRARPFKTESSATVEEMKRAASSMFGRLQMSGYARFDFRVDKAGRPFLIDVNANPNLARDEDFATSARFAGWSYEDLLRRILESAIQYRPCL